MKKFILGVIAALAVASLIAFTPAGGSTETKAAMNYEKEINDLKVQVAELNLRLTKIESAATPAPQQKNGGFQAR